MRDLRDLYDPHFSATIAGNRFTVHCPTAQEGLRLRLIAANPNKEKPGNDLEEINKLFRGDPITDEQTHLPTGGLWEELWAAGVTWEEAFHLGITAFTYFAWGENAAQNMWEKAGNLDPKVQNLIRQRMYGQNF